MTPTISRLWRLTIHVVARGPQLGCMAWLAAQLGVDQPLDFFEWGNNSDASVHIRIRALGVVCISVCGISIEVAMNESQQANRRPI